MSLLSFIKMAFCCTVTTRVQRQRLLQVKKKNWEVVSQCTSLDFLVLGLNVISAQGEARLVIDQLHLDVRHQRRWRNSPRSPRGHRSYRDVCRRLIYAQEKVEDQ